VETSVDGENWAEVDRREDNAKLNGSGRTRIFKVSKSGICRFIRLVNIGRNHGYDRLSFSAWEIFGSLINPRGSAQAPFVPVCPWEGIIGHLTRECRGNVDDRGVVGVSSSRLYKDKPKYAARNVVDLEDAYSVFISGSRWGPSSIPHVRNNWIGYDFKNRRVVLTHYAIRSSLFGPHLRSWLVETSVDGQNWVEFDYRENNTELNGSGATRTFGTARSGECRYIRLVNIGRNHDDNDRIAISAWEIFGSLIE
jgi:hypothetical protein